MAERADSVEPPDLVDLRGLPGLPGLADLAELVNLQDLADLPHMSDLAGLANLSDRFNLAPLIRLAAINIISPHARARARAPPPLEEAARQRARNAVPRQPRAAGRVQAVHESPCALCASEFL